MDYMDELEKYGGSLSSSGAGDDEEEELEEFNKKIEQLQRELGRNEEDMKELAQVYKESLNVVKEEDQAKFSTMIKKQVQTIVDRSSRIKKELNAIEQENSRLREQNPSDPLNQIRMNQHHAVVRKFMDQIKKFNDLQKDHKENLKKNFKRTLEIQGIEKDDDEVEEMVSQGNILSLFSGELRDIAKKVHDDVSNKYEEILNLERSINELHQLFVDMSLLVSEQGEMIDNIERGVLEAEEYVQKGNEQIEKAIRLSKSKRKKSIFLIMLIGCIVIAFMMFGITLLRTLSP